VGTDRWIEGWYGKPMEFQLYCQEPGCWHPAGKPYPFEDPAKWLKRLSPYLQKFFAFFKYTPIANFGFSTEATNLEEFVRRDVMLMSQLIENLKRLQESRVRELGKEEWEPGDPGFAVPAEGAQWRVLRQLLDKLDPAHEWGGLRKVFTPEGHYLWLCRYHADKYES
jgi:internalin A